MKRRIRRMFRALCLLAACGAMAHTARGANLMITQPEDPFEPLPAALKETFLEEGKDAGFLRETDGFAWISDIEHVMFPDREEVFLADAPGSYSLFAAEVPAAKFFELFPYHYYDKKEEERLGGRIHYRLVAQNRTPEAVLLEIEGFGSTRGWEHREAWEAALQGGGRRAVRLAPGEILTLWEERALEGGLPWSAILLGRASGPLWVCDYAWLGEREPDPTTLTPMPDLALAPTLWPSFTRGTGEWNAAEVLWFPERRTAGGRIALSRVEPGAYSVAFGDSPGGPLNKPCVYTAVAPSFAEDEYPVFDPVSGETHLFFGGNYPVMYSLRAPLVNDTPEPRRVSLYLCANDKFKVDSILGVWMEGRMSGRRTPMWERNERWRVWTLELAPGEMQTVECLVVALGGRWGGAVATLAIEPLPAAP